MFLYMTNMKNYLESIQFNKKRGTTLNRPTRLTRGPACSFRRSNPSST